MSDITPISAAEGEAALRTDFYLFAIRCFTELNPGVEFAGNWHLEVIAAALERCRKGETRRLIINLPPRHLKSLMASIALPAWLLGHNPGAQIINVTYGQELSDKQADDCRKIMRSRWYQSLFGVELGARAPVHDFSTTKGGFRLATSVGGALTGRGADFIIVDDPLKADEAVSDAARNRVNEWFDTTLLSRLNSKSTGVIIVIMQRLHEDDLVGHLLARRGWEVLSLPAIAPEDEVHDIETPFGQRRFSRKKGEALHPGRESLATLEEVRRAIGEYNFAAQYQQAPLPANGFIKPEWLKICPPGNWPESFQQIVQSWDTANKPTETANYSVCTTWGIKDGSVYLLDVFRERLDYRALKHAVISQKALRKAETVLIEDKASGTQLLQDLAHDGFWATTCTSQGDKIARMQAQIGFFESGLVYVPDRAPWLADYLDELRTFPKGRYDDQVDSTAQFLAWFKNAPHSTPGFIDYYRTLAEEACGKKARVRIRVNGDVSRVITAEGESIPVPADKIVEVPEDTARSMLANGKATVISTSGQNL